MKTYLVEAILPPVLFIAAGLCLSQALAQEDPQDLSEPKVEVQEPKQPLKNCVNPCAHCRAWTVLIPEQSKAILKTVHALHSGIDDRIRQLEKRVKRLEEKVFDGGE